MNDNTASAIPAKEVRGATQQMGACRFCGQTAMINTTGAADDEWVDEQVTLQCPCTEAKYYKKIHEFNCEIELLINEFPGLTDLVKNAAELVRECRIASVSINTGLKTKINITMDSKGNLKVKKTKTLQDEIGM